MMTALNGLVVSGAAFGIAVIFIFTVGVRIDAGGAFSSVAFRGFLLLARGRDGLGFGRGEVALAVSKECRVWVKQQPVLIGSLERALTTRANRSIPWIPTPMEPCCSKFINESMWLSSGPFDSTKAAWSEKSGVGSIATRRLRCFLPGFSEPACPSPLTDPMHR
jgi:hypothetical protein